MANDFSFLKSNLAELDQDTHNIIEFEKRRQERKLILIASESICSKATLEAQSSVFSNIYAEGYPLIRMSQREREEVLNYAKFLSFHRRYGDRRHYKGCDYANFIESLAQLRAAKLFAHGDIKPEDIFVNVQTLSGAAANNAVYQALVEPGATIMGLALPHGGHLTHGSEFNRSGKTYNVISYEVDLKTGKIDYKQLREKAIKYKPRMIIGGASAYPWDIDWKFLREVADEVGALLLADVSHPSGLIATGLFSNPVGYAHVSSMTTHKTLCGPRGAILLSTDENIAKKLDNAVFPGEQGGPHLNTICGLAVAFKVAASDGFKNMMRKVVKNAHILGETFKKHGLSLAYGGTSTHLCLIDLNKIKNSSPLKGDIASNILDLCGITCNKNTIPGDITSADSSAIRVGATWITQIGMEEKEVEKIGELIAEVLKNIKTYEIETGGGTRGRGKIASRIMEKVRKEVAKLLANHEHPLYPKYPHYNYLEDSRKRDELDRIIQDIETTEDFSKENIIIDTSEQGVLLVEGERADIFLTEIITGNLMKLSPNKGFITCILDEEGEVIDEVSLFKLERKLPSFLLVTSPNKRETVKNWLRDLSDGYVLFDKSCIFSKISGPAVIQDIYEDYQPSISFTLITNNIKKLIGEDISSFEIKEVSFENIKFSISRKEDNFYEFYLSVKDVKTFIDIVKNRLGTILRASGNTAKKSKDLSQLIHMEKPYFIGQQSVKNELKHEKKEHTFKLYEGEIRKTPLYETHQKLTDRPLVPFAGWEMPVLYSSILDEHEAVRKAAGLFDVTHMGVLEVSGVGASRYLDLVTTNYATKLRVGQSHYSYLLDPSGEVIDDIMVYRRAKDKFMVVVNAANAEKDFTWLQAVASRNVIIDTSFPQREIDVNPTIRDLRDPQYGKDRMVDIALQGPSSLKILQAIISHDSVKKQVASMSKSTFIETQIDGVDIIISRSGYTGEDIGFEFYLHPDNVARIWNLLLEKGKPFGILPTGLGARDSTRTEAGFPLYGHELSGELHVSPMEAGYGSFVKYHKPFFIGKYELLKRDKASKNTIVRFEMSNVGIRAVRPGAMVVNKRGKVIGYVTSCAFVDNKQIGMAYLNKRFAKEGEKLGIFILAAGKKVNHKNIMEMQTGDSFPLHESAKVVSRFPMRTLEPSEAE